MKILCPLFLISLLLLNSCHQSTAKEQQQAVADIMDKNGDTEVQVKANTLSPTPVTEVIANSGLIGKWETSLLTGDNNSNGKLDPEEIGQGTKEYKDYLELQPDGTCVYSVAKLPAVYEIVEKDGNRSIEIIVADGSRIKQGRIISLQANELQLMKFSGGRDIIVYRRI